MRQMDHRVDLMSFQQNAWVLNRSKTLGTYPADLRWQRLFHYYRSALLDAAGLVCARDYDLLYVRFQMGMPYLYETLRQFKQRNPELKIVLETPTFPYHGEVRTLRDHFLYRWDARTRNRLHRVCDRVVTYCGQHEVMGIPAVSLSNGFDPDQVPCCPKPHVDPASLHFVGVSSLADWHGYDRVVRGLERYYAGGNPRTQVFFQMVGTGRATEEMARLVGRSPAAPHIGMSPNLSGEALDALFHRMDLGISGLGLHRKGLETASDLKSREYCARGKPFVQSFRDEAFPPDRFPYALRVPADDTPLDIAELVEFTLGLYRSDPHFPARIRAYAEETLTWKRQLSKVPELG